MCSALGCEGSVAFEVLPFHADRGDKYVAKRAFCLSVCLKITLGR